MPTESSSLLSLSLESEHITDSSKTLHKLKKETSKTLPRSLSLIKWCQSWINNETFQRLTTNMQNTSRDYVNDLPLILPLPSQHEQTIAIQTMQNTRQLTIQTMQNTRQLTIQKTRQLHELQQTCAKFSSASLETNPNNGNIPYPYNIWLKKKPQLILSLTLNLNRSCWNSYCTCMCHAVPSLELVIEPEAVGVPACVRDKHSGNVSCKVIPWQACKPICRIPTTIIWLEYSPLGGNDKSCLKNHKSFETC